MNTTPASRAPAGVPAGPVAHNRHQFRLPFDGPSPGSEPYGPLPAPFPGPPVFRQIPEPPGPGPVTFVRHARARRYVLRVEPDGRVRVTIPRSGSRRQAEEFLARSRAWVERQRRKLSGGLAARLALSDGDEVLLAGVRTPIVVSAAPSGLRVRLGGTEVRGGHTADPRDLVAVALRALAQRQLPGRLHELAEECQLTVRKVSVRNQKGRWGSCSSSGTISLNWRLVQVPPSVRDYVLLHELMHLKEANHSRRFWRHVARACPWHLEARRWLRHEGTALL
jgi:hypothetical protein